MAAVTPSTWLLSGTQIAVGAGVGTVGHKQISVNILMRIDRKYFTDICKTLCSVFYAILLEL